MVPLKALSMPPRIKVLEALGCIADGRIEVMGEATALVKSSDGSKVYRVYVDLERGVAFSDDNGTAIRGYVGYPIIAFLMLKGRLPFKRSLAEALRGIPWRELNERYKSYAVVERVVKSVAAKKGVSPGELDAFVGEVLKALSKVKLVYDEGVAAALKA